MTGGGAALSLITDGKLTQFVHHVVDHMCGGQPVTYELYKDCCPLDKFWVALQEAKTVAKNVTLNKLPKKEVFSILPELGEARAGSVYDALSARKGELEDVLVREALQNTQHLKDFDWNVRLAVSSDKVMDLNEPLLILHLHLSSDQSEGGRDKDVCVEMTAPQVDSLLQKLNEAQGTLTQLASQRPPP